MSILDLQIRQSLNLYSGKLKNVKVMNIRSILTFTSNCLIIIILIKIKIKMKKKKENNKYITYAAMYTLCL